MENNTLTVPSSTDSLTAVESLINELCSSCKINEDHYGNILVAVTEAVTNAIQHGNKFNPDKHIDIRVNSTPTKLTFLIQDEGQGFDLSLIPDPTDPEHIEKPHGRGVFLMKHLADEVDFIDNGRQVQLSFYIGAN